jgi:hypothetical protein
MTYEQAAARAETLAEVVRDRKMPPWFGVHAKDAFVNHRGLTAQERETFTTWARTGKERGDLAKAPKSTWKEEVQPLSWRIPEPDLVLKVPQHELPASGDIPYKYALLSHIFAEDTWVQAIEIRPDNPRVLHHCNMAYIQPPEGFKLKNFITGAVPGSDPMNLEEGVAFRIPKGSVLGLQIHYVSTGKEETCKLTVGIRYAKGVINKQLQFQLMVDHKFAIPPGAPFHPVQAQRTLDRDVLGVALFSHMHVRGKDMTFRAEYPDGTTEKLLTVPNYNFDWQLVYRYAPGQKRFPKGTKFDCLAHYDNSAFNPYNPDPTATVKDGLQTHEEMMNGFFFYVGADEQLGLRMDPKTGRAISDASEKRR